MCFDSTYEGLKLEHALVEDLLGERFDSTYEGLKLWPRSTLPPGEHGFDSTYEGLKPLPRARGGGGGSVSTVPMRA